MSITVKNAKQNYKGSFFKRIVRESLILSCLNMLSERILKLFSSGILYSVFCGSEKTDELLESGAIGHLINKAGIGRRFILPFKVFFANGIEKSHIVTLYRRLIHLLLSISVRFFGVLNFTFGIYGVGIYFAKSFSYITATPSENDFFWSVLLIIAGTPMLLSGKSVAYVLKTSKIFNWLFIGILGINEMTLRAENKSDTYATTAFVLGSVLGITTIFVSPSTITLTVIAAVICAVILYTPELGLLSVILLFPLVSVRLLAVIIMITVISYFLKVLRVKRNLKFKTADIFILFFIFYLAAVGLLSGSGGQIRTLYLICFLAVYFLISNLIVSWNLIRQILFSLCTGVTVSCLLYILKNIASGTETIHLSEFINSLGNSLVTRESFGYLLIFMLPVCISLFKINRYRIEKASLLILIFLILACIILRADRNVLIALYGIIFLYSLFVFKKPVTTLLMFVILTTVLNFFIPYIPFINTVFSETSNQLVNGGVDKLVITFLLTGVGIGDHAIAAGLNKVGVSSNIDTISLFDRILAEGGIFFLISFLLVVFFILQKSFNCISSIRIINIRLTSVTRAVEYTAAFTAVIFIFLSLGIFNDIWTDIRIYLFFWIACGMISAISHVNNRTLTVKEAKDNE